MLDLLKVISEMKVQLTQKLKSVFGMAENIVERGENADCFFHNVLKSLFLSVVKTWDCLGKA